MADVAADRDLEAGELALVRADRRAVEQRLRRVLVGAVARVDDRGAKLLGEHLGGARLRVADDDHVGRHRVQVARGVQQRLALAVDDAEPEMLTASADSRLAAISNDVRVRVDGSRNRLITVLPAQRRHLLDRALVDLEEPLAEVEDRLDLGRRQRLDAEQVTVSERAHAGRSRSTTRSGSPRSDSMTRTDSRAVVCSGQADDVGLDRQLAQAAIDQRRQLHRARAAVVGEHVHRGADGAPGEQHVVDQDDGPPVDRLGQLGRARSRAWADR